jgi:hypothetical protein
MSKGTPDEREEFRQLIERGRVARANMQAILDRAEARRAEREARIERRRRLLRRFFPFRGAA